MKDKIKEILIDRLGQVVKDDVIEDLSTEINQIVRHDQFMQSDNKDNITIDDLINHKARVGDVFKYRDDYYEIVEDDTHCGFNGISCSACPLDVHGCMNLKGFIKI